MGNCCSEPGSSSSANWGGEDWGSVSGRKIVLYEERQTLLESLSSESSSTSSVSEAAAATSRHGEIEIKIKVSRKELGRLMETRERHRQVPSASRVLSRLTKTDMNGYHECREMEHPPHSWRPGLKTISEGN